MGNVYHVYTTVKKRFESVPVHLFLCLCLVCFHFTGCSPPDNQKQDQKVTPGKSISVARLPKALLVNSYHFSFPWTNGITRSIAASFKVALTQEGVVADGHDRLVDLKIIYMDTKRNTDENFIKSAALQAKEEIERWQPDVILTSDDNAAKYLIVPYYNNSEIPVVFCGINWSAAEYGFSTSNVTGMLEVQLVDQIVDIMRSYAKGERVAYIKGDDSSARKEAGFFEERLGIELDKQFVTSFSQWKEQYIALQNEADMILVGNWAALEDWNEVEALQLIAEHTTVPSGNWDQWVAPYTLVTLATKPEEQGSWAAQTALRILQGASPSAIGFSHNKLARVYLSRKLAGKLGITFPMPLVNQAIFVE
ncbi:ABC transporter substrate-binding protein [Desulfogranum marinum]|uniref:ABC transporter substrate-binding protein n=1 Tax=Desulfogranum marinum TaxID=453220 RepID=UPI00196502D1|nr:ABC transporter substrate binding protein [Desulfogranum marinum]MBM9514738.1 hypothetical protein [Desulfogranum marinum]